MAGETVAKFRFRTDMPVLIELRDRLGGWIDSVMNVLETPVKGIPDQLEDRAEDAWEPLLAIADAAGGSWPDRARVAAVKLAQDAASDGEDQWDVRILVDVKTLFDGAGDSSFLSSAMLTKGLREMEDSPWSDDDRFTPRRLAVRLRKFGVEPRHNATKSLRGYHLEDLRDVFDRYIPSVPSAPVQTTYEREDIADGSDLTDTSIRPLPSKRPRETAGPAGNGQIRTGWTGRGNQRGANCPICGHSPPRRGSFGWIACEHQLADPPGHVPATNPTELS